MLHDFPVEIYSAISILLKTAADSNAASQHGSRRPDRFPRKTAPPRDWPRSTNGSASRALRREMAAAYDHSDHNAPAIRHCDVIAYYRTFISCSCVRIRSGVSHVGLPWLRPTQVQVSWESPSVARTRSNSPVEKRNRARRRSRRHALQRRAVAERYAFSFLRGELIPYFRSSSSSSSSSSVIDVSVPTSRPSIAPRSLVAVTDCESSTSDNVSILAFLLS